MSRLVLPALAVLAVAVSCGGNRDSAEPVAETTSEETAETARGDPTAGRGLFTSSNLKCGACHTLTDAGTDGTDDGPPAGPRLDDLPSLAAQANRGSLEEFIRESIAMPGAYTEPGFEEGLMRRPAVTNAEIEDLVAYLLQVSQSG